MKFLFFLFIPTLCFADSTRLDPHGSKGDDYKTVKSLKDLTQCTVCHQEKDGKVILKPNSVEMCQSCHSKSPHSGAADHIGRLYKGSKISCSTCHTSHRSQNEMMRKTCTDCHQWH